MIFATIFGIFFVLARFEVSHEWKHFQTSHHKKKKKKKKKNHHSIVLETL